MIKKLRKAKKLRFLITAGPTREALDPVRYFSNRSSGKMGYALAAAACRLGQTTLISGPVTLAPPRSAKIIRVVTAREMARVTLQESRKADIILQCAAVADYSPARVSKQKIKKTGAGLSIKMIPTLDILSALGRNKKNGQLLVGFAAETNRLKKNALLKLRRKNLDFIVANPVDRKNSGFESDFNTAVVFGRKGFEKKFPRMSKTLLARKLLTLFVTQS